MKHDRNFRGLLYRSRLLAAAVVVAVLLATSTPALAAGASVQHYRIVSAVEYSGQTQFASQAETLVSVNREPLADGTVRYQVHSGDVSGFEGPVTPLQMGFVVDNRARRMTAMDPDIGTWARLSSESVRSLKKVSSRCVGTTWKESVRTGQMSNVVGSSLRFTVTAMKVHSAMYGDLVAVRAMSEPFTVNCQAGPARAKVNSLYLFDSKIQSIYMSMCVFETATMARGFKEVLHSEIVTYRTDASGQGLDLSDLGDNFAALADKVGLLAEGPQADATGQMPQWARATGLQAAQACNIYSATVCEGNLNPVMSVAIPGAELLAMQSKSQPTKNAPKKKGNVARNGPGKEMKVLGLNLKNPWVLGGVVAGAVAPVAISGGGGGGGGSVASP